MRRVAAGNAYLRIALTLLGLFALAVLMYFGGKGALNSLLGAHIGFLALAFGATCSTTLISAQRWAAMSRLSGGGGEFGYAAYYRSFILSRAAGLLLSSGPGELAFRPALHRQATGTRVASTFGVMLLERGADMTLALAAGVPATLYSLGRIGTYNLWGSLLAVLALWVLCLILMGPRILSASAWMINALGRLHDWNRGNSVRFAGACLQARAFLLSLAQQRAALKSLALLSALRYVLIGFQFILVSHSLRLGDIGAAEIVAALPVAQLAAIVAVTPGGIGFLEGGFFGALTAMGVGSESIASFLVGQRVLISAFVLILSALAVFSWPWARIRPSGDERGRELKAQDRRP